MHEHSLFAAVPAAQHHVLLQQLAGVTAMQPAPVYERRLIFRPHKAPGYLKPRLGATQDVQATEIQKLNRMLNARLFYVQAVGDVAEADFGSGDDVAMGGAGLDSPRQDRYDVADQSWRIEFRDIPDAGTSAVTSRLMCTAKIPYGDIVPIMKAWGYDYVSEHVLEGSLFVLDDTVLLLHRILTFPPDDSAKRAPARRLPGLQTLLPLDKSGGFVLQASIIVQDSVNRDMMDTASQRLLRLKEQLKSAVKLEPADRLALDTKVK
ncbi:Mediator of RNA polymerase II transcription subunit 18 [Ophidiomyces ophidiicola]|nr:Mediator of RNA polymerase II transcription subunit 18 [Ophidiomyces ophidiicola]KAI2040302.1 Mediator of RNA polymerase II transcription subunit 18 [Ophidiomyces ophidiicola]KAI2064427.1 Mediator of RNA polymerase II transcription subunit 18 [Ophidiomyces ophidiicola]KAI2070056.1 Mediator of RNA polymerase II transcription subunit 18 [Ophidiomyces ophidiicola]KAI2070336.1 Mediator of RNA polymerase II transcription subunit 18 [Ophidiomyces ophidiicola]